VISVKDLTVRFGGVKPLDSVSLSFEAATNGLLGPNGAGKTTFFNVLSGFVRPEAGGIEVDGTDLLAMPGFKRARWGLRRSFQQEQAIEDLSVHDNVAMVHEHSGGSRSGRREAVEGALDFADLEPLADQWVAGLGARERRLVELARAVVGSPRLVLLDEPAAGLSDAESQRMGELIAAIPARFGAQVILVDHDIDLVSSCCEAAAVLDFGKLIATGPTREVLADPKVVEAYLGEAVA
jgi:ABC-type branched-subunit amino acid transport system ATPase component